MFARLGGLHRNTFINSPRLLDGALRLKADPRLRFAGQITGVEGYVESAAIGLIAGRLAAAERLGRGARCRRRRRPRSAPSSATSPAATSAGAAFQPMNINYGLLPPLDAPVLGKGRGERGRARKRAMGVRALADLERWLAGSARLAAE